MSTAIEVRGLTTACGTRVLLDGVDLDVPAGTVFALLGSRIRSSFADPES